MAATLFHNPKCSTSRKALELLREADVEPTVVDYLKTGWDRETLMRLADRTGLGPRGLLRRKEAEAVELLAAEASDAQILDAMVARPVLVERPIVETPRGARLGRPVETIREIL